MPISRKVGPRPGRAAAVGATLLALTGCTPPPAGGVAAGPIPPGQARIWFYREYEPSVSFNLANVELNGAVVASVPAYGPGVYRDVAPGHYRISVQTYATDVNQTQEVDLAPGQEVFAEIEDAPISGGDLTTFQRDSYYVRLRPPDIARAQIAASPR